MRQRPTCDVGSTLVFEILTGMEIPYYRHKRKTGLYKQMVGVTVVTTECGWMPSSESISDRRRLHRVLSK
jgi:hypothetical protein